MSFVFLVKTGSPFNPYGNGMITRQSVLRTAEMGRTLNNMETERSWLVWNMNSGRNSVSKTWKGYELVPDRSAPMLLREDSPLHAKCEFDPHIVISKFT